MKRIGRFCAACLALLAGCLCLSVWAEGGDAAAVAAALRQGGIDAASAQLQIRGDTAACFLEIGGRKTLCLLDRQGGWHVAVRNDRALWQERALPELLLEDARTVCWTYRSGGLTARFSSARGENGVWGRVSQRVVEQVGERRFVHLIFWDEGNGGEIVKFTSLEEKTPGLNVHDTTGEYLPAPWLSAFGTLDGFDLSRFPAIDPSYGNELWQPQAFLREAAGRLMPGALCLGARLQDGDMHFLMQKPDGARVYAVCRYDGRPRRAAVTESAPLPAGTFLGVENFSDCLGIGELAAAVQRFPGRGQIGLRYVYARRDAQDCFVFFGPDCAMVRGEPIWFGAHPWGDITCIDWAHLPQSLADALAHMDASGYAAVRNPNPADRLHLRAEPRKDSESLGKYYNGTPVRVLEERGKWAQVEVFGRIGWMMREYLQAARPGQALRCDHSPMPRLQMRGQELRVHTEPMQSAWHATRYTDTDMQVIGVLGRDWYHVWFPLTGESGFVRQADLWPGNG